MKQVEKEQDNKPRVARMGATIALPAYSSIRIDVVEPIEGEGLDINKTALYLKSIAKNLGGTLALPTLEGEKTEKKTKETKKAGKLQADFFGRPMEYDEALHRYSVNDVVFASVTTIVDQFYPMDKGGFIAPEYLENAAMYGSFIHKIFENAVNGFLAAKPSIRTLQQQVLDFIKGLDTSDGLYTEQMIFDDELMMAGRCDVLAGHTLIDWKTNNDLFALKQCKLSDEVLELLGDVANWNTIWGSYVLQQNFYAYMFNKQKAGTVKEAKIVWAPDLDKEITVRDVPLLTEEQILAVLAQYNRPN
ncbi:MAG: hypothetical protein NC218_03610 [Acetobacter sp.]|nr:hypothetical protein [Acetobacter sp.]